MSNSIIIKTVGWGTAASNIGPMGNTLHVIVHEWHSMHDGKINVGVDVLESSSKDVDGVVTADKIQSTETIHATWMPSGSNRLTAPNVRVGERVEVLEESDTGKYYWRPAGLDEVHRRLETIIWGISGTPNEEDDPFDPDNRYWIEFSTHSKKIVLTTSAKNGEKARYNISIDGGEGLLNIMDNKGNFATLDSNEDDWKIATVQGSFLELDKEDINIVAVRDMTANIGRNMSTSVGNNFTLKVGNNSNTSVGGNKSTEVSGNISEGAGGNISVSASGNFSASAGGSASMSGATASVAGALSASVVGGGTSISCTAAGLSMSGGGSGMSMKGGGISWTGSHFIGNE